MTDSIDLMDPTELSRLLNIPVSTITRLALEGKIPASKVGRQWRFIKQDIERWLRTTASNRTYRVLVVDDDPEVIRSIQRIISHAGHEVVTALGGQKAQDVLTLDSRFSLLILDLKMPEVNGPDVVEWMRRQQIKIMTIVLTAFADSSMMERMLELGHFTVLRKPFDPGELLHVVERLLVGAELHDSSE